MNVRGYIIGMQYNLIPFKPKGKVPLYNILTKENEIPQLVYLLNCKLGNITPFYLSLNGFVAACKESVLPVSDGKKNVIQKQNIKENVIIIIDDKEIINESQNNPKTNKKSKNWTVIFATDIVDGVNQLDSIIKDRNKRIFKNFIIRSHGSTWMYKIAQMKGVEKTGPVELTTLDVQNYGKGENNDISEENVNSIKALANIKDFVIENGNVIFTGCYGADNKISEELVKNFKWDSINIYSNNEAGGAIGNRTFKSVFYVEGNNLQHDKTPGKWKLIKAGTKPDENGIINSTLEDIIIKISDNKAAPIVITKRK